MTLIRPRSVDLRLLDLTTEQAFVLSRVDRPITMSDLATLSGVDHERLLDIVADLAMQGAVDLDGQTVRPQPAEIALEVRGTTDVGRSRSNNEDALSVVDVTAGREIDVLEPTSIARASRVLLAVSDGMGGENAGEVASALVVEALREHLLAHPSDDDPADTLAAAVRHANARLLEAAAEPGREGMGATLAAVVVVGGTAITAEIGDSRIYLFRRGVLGQVSKDQTHLQLLLQSGLSSTDLLRSRAKNIVLQACGKAEALTVAQRRFSLCAGDRLLLCTDGLTLHVEDAEIEAVLATADTTACDALVKMANDRGGKDNVTVLIADVVGGAPPTDADELIEVLREYGVDDDAQSAEDDGSTNA